MPELLAAPRGRRKGAAKAIEHGAITARARSGLKEGAHHGPSSTSSIRFGRISALPRRGGVRKRSEFSAKRGHRDIDRRRRPFRHDGQLGHGWKLEPWSKRWRPSDGHRREHGNGRFGRHHRRIDGGGRRGRRRHRGSKLRVRRRGWVGRDGWKGGRRTSIGRRRSGDVFGNRPFRRRPRSDLGKWNQLHDDARRRSVLRERDRRRFESRSRPAVRCELHSHVQQ